MLHVLSAKLFTEMVALIGGGNGFVRMEAYSPDGRCSQDLGNLPNEVNNLVPAMGTINGRITICSRYGPYSLGCSSYNPATSAWNAITLFPSSYYYSWPPGTSKFFFSKTRLQVFTIETNVP